jgi:hypothetical protein
MSLETLQLEADEVAIKIIHRHWLTLFTRLFGLAVFAIIPLLAWIIIIVTQSLSPKLLLDIRLYTTHFGFIYSTWLLYTTMVVASAITNHYLDAFIVTNRRIIIIDQQGFFKRQIGSFRHDKLQDVNIEINGLIATLFDYGTVEAETASSSSGEFRAYHLPHPNEVKAIILKASQSLS